MWSEKEKARAEGKDEGEKDEADGADGASGYHRGERAH